MVWKLGFGMCKFCDVHLVPGFHEHGSNVAFSGGKQLINVNRQQQTCRKKELKTMKT